jgi:uncharacterized ferritin-like protein (DUF455 family)
VKQGLGALPLEPGRDRLLRLDSAALLRRFWHLERALTITCAAWVPGVRLLETKECLARTAWQNAMTGQALRQRVFELRYPDRTMEWSAGAGLLRLFQSGMHAPSAGALLDAMSRTFAPALLGAYRAYLDASDDVADGPTRRFLEIAANEKGAQVAELGAFAQAEYEDGAERGEGAGWIASLGVLMDELGGVSLEGPSNGDDVPAVVPPGRPFTLPDIPSRDERFFVSNFYWPDNFDPTYPYGEGTRLQIRSAVSHLNEVWAVETAGAILYAFADGLGPEFLVDGARWLYDESRHMEMGRRRLEWWGFDPTEIPLGSYIYESCAGVDPIYRMGMLAFFETKNIGKKRDRVDMFAAIGDRTSQRDMDFDWADEAIHAGYGRLWLRRALEGEGRSGDDWKEVIATCEGLVRERVERATQAEKAAVRSAADHLVAIAEEKAAAMESRQTDSWESRSEERRQ